MATSTGYGPRAKILFNGDERKYELWEAKFMGYLHILKLEETVESEEPNAAKMPMYKQVYTCNTAINLS